MHSLFNDTLTSDDTSWRATTSRYFETADHLPSVIDVQAVLGGANDGTDVVYIGPLILTRSGLEALHDHLGEIRAALDEIRE